MRSQCASLGIDPERLVPAPGARPKEEVFELWPEHEEAFEVFSVCRRQWRLSVGMGGAWFQGLDLGAVDVAMRCLDIAPERRREVLLQLQVMEDEGVAVLNA